MDTHKNVPNDPKDGEVWLMESLKKVVKEASESYANSYKSQLPEFIKAGDLRNEASYDILSAHRRGSINKDAYTVTGELKRPYVFTTVRNATLECIRKYRIDEKDKTGKKKPEYEVPLEDGHIRKVGGVNDIDARHTQDERNYWLEKFLSRVPRNEKQEIVLREVWMNGREIPDVCDEYKCFRSRKDVYDTALSLKRALREAFERLSPSEQALLRELFDRR